MIDEAIYELTKIKIKNYEKDKNEVLKTLTPNSNPVVYIYKLK